MWNPTCTRCWRRFWRITPLLPKGTTSLFLVIFVLFFILLYFESRDLLLFFTPTLKLRFFDPFFKRLSFLLQLLFLLSPFSLIWIFLVSLFLLWEIKMILATLKNTGRSLVTQASARCKAHCIESNHLCKHYLFPNFPSRLFGLTSNYVPSELLLARRAWDWSPPRITSAMLVPSRRNLQVT